MKERMKRYSTPPPFSLSPVDAPNAKKKKEYRHNDGVDISLFFLCKMSFISCKNKKKTLLMD